MKLVIVLKRIQYTDKFLQNAKKLQINDHFGLVDSKGFSFRKRTYLLGQMFNETRDLLTQEKYKTRKRNTIQSSCNPLFHSFKIEAVHRTALRKSRCDIIDMLLNNTSKLDSIHDYLGVNAHVLTDSMLEEVFKQCHEAFTYKQKSV